MDQMQDAPPMRLIRIIKSNYPFVIPYGMFLAAGGLLMLIYTKEEIHLYINQYHAPVFDYFFRYVTLVGLGWLIVPVALGLAFVRLRYVIGSVTAFLLATILTDTIKFLDGAPRPAEYFSHLHTSLYTVPGVDLYHWNSFPSGHSAIAFCLFGFLAFVSASRLMKFGWFTFALLVAYSRMYLSEHFLIDVYFASIIGFFSAIAAFIIVENAGWLNKIKSIDKPLIKL